MDIAVLLLLPCVFWGMGFSGKGFREDYLSIETSKALRGILVLLVMLHHMSRQMEGLSLFLLDNVGVLCVCVFFFLSGYGLQRRYDTRPGYPQSILRKRIPSVLRPYLVLIGIYWAFDAAMGCPMTLGQVLHSLVSGDPVVTYSWYILSILVLYGNYYLSTRIYSPGDRNMVKYHVVFAVLWAVLCRMLGYGSFWYNSIIAFPMGICWAMEEGKGVPRLRKRYLLNLTAGAALFCGTFLAALYTAGEDRISLSLYWTADCAFLLTLLLVLMKFSFRNRLLLFLGEISFEIYGIHGLFLRLYRSSWIFIENDTLWCLAVIGSAVAAGWGLHRLFRRPEE